MGDGGLEDEHLDRVERTPARVSDNVDTLHDVLQGLVPRRP